MTDTTPRNPRPSEADAVKALRSPIRVQLLRHMRGRDETSPTELARDLGVELGTMSYHVRILHRLGFLELCGRKKVRGADLHLYTLVPGVEGLLRTVGARTLAPEQSASRIATGRIDRRALPGLLADVAALEDRIKELDVRKPSAAVDVVTVDLAFTFDPDAGSAP